VELPTISTLYVLFLGLITYYIWFETLYLNLFSVSDCVVLYMNMYMQWAHFPHIHFGLKLDGNKQGKLDQGDATQKSNGFY